MNNLDGLPISEAVKQLLLSTFPANIEALKKGLPMITPISSNSASNSGGLNPAHARLVQLIFNLFTQFADKVPEINYVPVLTLLSGQLLNDEQTLAAAQRNADINTNTLALLDQAGQQLQSAALVSWETVNGLKNRLDAATGGHSENYPDERITDFIYNTSGMIEDKLQSLLKISQTLEDGVTLKAPASPAPPDINTNSNFIAAVNAYDKK